VSLLNGIGGLASLFVAWSTMAALAQNVDIYFASDYLVY